MKTIFNNFIPFDGFAAINLFGILFVRNGVYKNNKVPKRTINHESIHTAQIKELGYILFYIWYFIEWLLLLPFFGTNAYYNISFEREAYDNEKNYKYLENRKHYSWFKYYGKN